MKIWDLIVASAVILVVPTLVGCDSYYEKQRAERRQSQASQDHVA
jgi:hypothetical protein